jgi:hypothetical protein
MVNFLALPNRYPGLTRMAKYIGPYFPKSKIYVECFAGLAKTAKYARSQIVVLNDKSEYSNYYCKKKFPNAIIENMDFIDTIKKYDSKDTFFLIDPPWRIDFYQGKGMTARTKKGITAGYIDRSAKEYLDDLKKILPIIKGHYILTLPTNFDCRKKSGSMFFPALHSKTLKDIKPHIFGNYATTRLFSNKPLKIQIPTLEKFLN